VRQRIVLGLLACLVALPAMADEPRRRPLVVCHRGLLQAAPENTLAAFRACLALRVGFEFDIRRTKDGQLVCLHDAAVDRTTNGRGLLAELTLADLSRFDAGGWFDPVFRGERIPRVDEILKLVGEDSTGSAAMIAVDLKEVGGGLEEAVVRLAEEHKALDRLVFIGLAIESAEVRARLRAASKQSHVARLAAAAEQISDAIADPAADWVYLRFLPTADDVRRSHQAGKRVFLVGPLVAGMETENWNKAAEVGIDAILTDYPLEMQKQQRERSR